MQGLNSMSERTQSTGRLWNEILQQLKLGVQTVRWTSSNMLLQHHPQNIAVWKHLPIEQDSLHPQLIHILKKREIERAKNQDQELSKQVNTNGKSNHNKPKQNKIPSYIRTQLLERIEIR